MTPEEITLAKRLAAHERWEWDCSAADGMLAVNSHGEEILIDPHLVPPDMSDYFPDLHHWSTVGCLLGMLASEPGHNDLGAVQALRDTMHWNRPDGTETPRNYPYPGPALARLLLEIWGNDNAKRD